METGSDGEQARLSAWGPDSVRQRYGNIIAKVSEHKHATTTEEAQRYLREAEELLREYRMDLDEKVLDDFREAGVEDIDLERVREFEPFHWVLEFASVYADGGFDVVVGNPPWDVLTVDRNHFFWRYDIHFRTRPLREKDEKQEELLDDPEIATEWKKFQRNMQIRSDYYNASSQYTMQKPTVGGQTVATESDLSLLFFERVTQLAKQESYVAQIMPGNFFLGATAKDLRKYLIDEADLAHFVQFENKGIFKSIDDRYHFVICTFKNSGSTETVNGGFAKGDLSILSELGQSSIEIPSEVLRDYSPESLTFPFFRSQELIDSLSKFTQHPPIGERVAGTWFVSLYMKELDRANDSNLLIENPEEGDYPIYEGKNIHQFAYSNISKHDIKPVSLWGVEEDDLFVLLTLNEPTLLELQEHARHSR